MATNTDAVDLNARIVARLPPAELRQSCHDVLRDEATNVSDRLREVVEALGRLNKVEAAVRRLQQGKSDCRRSEGLVAMLTETERIRDELASRLKRMQFDPLSTRGAADEVSWMRVSVELVTRTPTQLLPASYEPWAATKAEAGTRRREPRRRVGGSAVVKLEQRVESPRARLKPRAASKLNESSDDSGDSDGSDNNDDSDYREDSESSEDDKATISSLSSSSSSSDSGDDSASSDDASASPRNQVSVPDRVSSRSDDRSAKVATVRAASSGKAPVTNRSSSKRDSDDSGNSNDSTSASDTERGSPSDWIKELTSHSAAVQSAAPQPRVAKRKSASRGKKKKMVGPKPMLVLAQDCLAKVNCSGSDGSLADAIEAVWDLILRVWDGADDLVHAQPTVTAVAEAITGLARRLTIAAVRYTEAIQVTELAAMLDSLCSTRPKLRASLDRAHAEFKSAVQMTKRNSNLQANTAPSLSLVLHIDTLSATERYNRLGDVTSSLKRAMSAKPHHLKSHTMNQLVSALGLVTSWVEKLPSGFKTAINLRAIRTFRHVVLRCVDNLPVSYVKGVESLMEQVRRVLVDAEMELIEEAAKEHSQKGGRGSVVAVATPKEWRAQLTGPAKSASSDSGSLAVELSRSLRGLSSSERAGQLHALMKSIVSAFQARSETKVMRETDRLTGVVELAVKWILEQPVTLSKLKRYRSFVHSVQIFAKRVPDQDGRDALLRMVEPLGKKLKDLQSGTFKA